MLEKYYNEPQGNIIKIFDEVLTMIERAHSDKYKDIMCKIHVAENGYHFNEEILHEALEHMVNDDGSKAPKWSIVDTTQVAKNNNITFDNFNEYDWNYVMNMMYSDYVTIFGDNLTYYLKMTTKFLMDKDAPEGKALRYYMAMKK